MHEQLKKSNTTKTGGKLIRDAGVFALVEFLVCCEDEIHYGVPI